MKNIFCLALLVVLVALPAAQADTRITCFRADADVGGKPFPEALQECMHHTQEYHEAEIETHKCMWRKLGVKLQPNGNLKEKTVHIATDEFKSKMAEVADACDKPTMEELCQCLDDKLTPLCNDDDQFITTTAATA